MGLHCQISLTNTYNRQYYYPGETLSGNIDITSDSDKKVKGTFIRFLFNFLCMGALQNQYEKIKTA